MKVNWPLLDNHPSISGQLLEHDVGGGLENGVGLRRDIAPVLLKLKALLTSVLFLTCTITALRVHSAPGLRYWSFVMPTKLQTENSSTYFRSFASRYNVVL